MTPIRKVRRQLAETITCWTRPRQTWRVLTHPYRPNGATVHPVIRHRSAVPR